MIELVCWLALIIVLAGCAGGSRPRRGKGVRHPDAPWMILYGDGGFELDLSHPRIRLKMKRDAELFRRIQEQQEAPK